MDLAWTREEHPVWDADKARIIGGAPAGAFDRRFKELAPGAPLPGDWWRAERGGKPVGYGWLDIVWGDAEILLATDPAEENHGVGSFVLGNLENEARNRGVNYVYNVVRPTHPQREKIQTWLGKRGFQASEDGSLLRATTRR
jgi:ribosomal protein S18 acetylase RimI-like enzyme